MKSLTCLRKVLIFGEKFEFICEKFEFGPRGLTCVLHFYSRKTEGFVNSKRPAGGENLGVGPDLGVGWSVVILLCCAFGVLVA